MSQQRDPGFNSYAKPPAGRPFTSPRTEEESRRKAEFDSSMVLVRHSIKYADTREAAEYFFREMKAQCDILGRKFGLGK